MPILSDSKVIIQGEMVNNIEKQVEDTVVHTEQARANIKQAVVYKQVRIHHSLIEDCDSFVTALLDTFTLLFRTHFLSEKAILQRKRCKRIVISFQKATRKKIICILLIVALVLILIVVAIVLGVVLSGRK